MKYMEVTLYETCYDELLDCYFGGELVTCHQIGVNLQYPNGEIVPVWDDAQGNSYVIETPCEGMPSEFIRVELVMKRYA